MATPTPVIAYLDHVLIACDDPAQADRVLTLFRDTLGWPQAWPPLDLPGYYTAGGRAGNVNLEIGARAGAPVHGRARFVGLVFAPTNLQEALVELDRRAIAHTPPQPYEDTAPNGQRGVLWISAHLPGFRDLGVNVALCEYQPILELPAANAAQTAQLLAAGGGPLGLRGVREVVVGAPDPEAALARWTALLAPATLDAERRWAPERLPALRLTAAPEDGVRELVLDVAERTAARRFLAGLPDAEPDPRDPDAFTLAGLPVRLVGPPA